VPKLLLENKSAWRSTSQDWLISQSLIDILLGELQVYNDSTKHDPAARPNTGPAGGPNTGPAGGPNTVPAGGPNTGPGAGPNTGPAGGANTGPAGGPNTGPGYTVNQNLAANESFGNESVLVSCDITT